LIGYQPGSGLLHRAHPFTALTVALGVVVLGFVLPGPWGPVGVAFAVLCVALLERVPAVIGTALGIAAPFWVFLLIIHGVFADVPLRAVALASRITAMVMVFLVVLSAVHPGRLIEALVQRRVPFAVAYLLAATLQAVPRLRNRARTILDAQRCRGLRFRGSLWRRGRALVPLVMPLVLGALAEVDERTMALEARGAGAVARRTPLDPPRDTTVDRVVRALLVITALSAVLARFL